MQKENLKRIEKSNGTYYVDLQEYEKFGANYDNMFNRLISNLDNPENITIVFGNEEHLGGNTIAFMLKEGEYNTDLFHCSKVFENDHSNDNEVVYTMLSEWEKRLAEVVSKEHFTVMYKGHPCLVSRVWANHRFTDEECQKLSNGEKIFFKYNAKNTGNLRYQTGYLDLDTFQYFNNTEGHWMIPDKSIPDSWNGHRFTEDEAFRILNGETVHITDFISKKTNKPYPGDIYLDDEGKLKLNLTRKNNTQKNTNISYENLEDYGMEAWGWRDVYN